MKLQIEVKTVYGKELLYPLNSIIGKQISILTGNKTITMYQLEALAALGHEIELLAYGRVISTIPAATKDLQLALAA